MCAHGPPHVDQLSGLHPIDVPSPSRTLPPLLPESVPNVNNMRETADYCSEYAYRARYWQVDEMKAVQPHHRNPLAPREGANWHDPAGRVRLLA